MQTSSTDLVNIIFCGFRALVVSTILFVPTFNVLAQTPTALPPLPGVNSSFASDINNRGEVVGRSDSTAVMWDRRGDPRVLPPLASDCCSSASAINARGEVLGGSNDGDSIEVVVWDKKGTPEIRRRPPLGEDCAFVFAADINNRGEAVGWCVGDAAPITTAVKWDQKGKPKVLPPLPGDANSIARAISARGQVVGTSYRANRLFGTAVMWSRNGTPKPMAPLDCDLPDCETGSQAYGINNRGEVVGESLAVTPGLGESTAVIWNSNGVARPLSQLENNGFEGGRDISAIGEATGFSRFSDGCCEDMAVVWDRSGTAIELPPLSGDDEAEGKAINSRGHVVGNSKGPGGTTAVIWR